jgi:nitrogen fixation protein NifU and related proteins
VALLDSLYKEIILEHYKSPRNRGELPDATHREEGLNPSCGDELELHLRVDDGHVADVKFSGQGCAISQASASMMTEAVKGQTVERALELSGLFKDMIHGKPPADDLGDLQTLQGIAKLHARVKCATLSWVTLDAALKRPAGEGRTEVDP